MKLRAILLVSILLCSPTEWRAHAFFGTAGPRQNAAKDKARETWMTGYLRLEQAAKTEEMHNDVQALQYYKEALVIFTKVQEDFPEWNPSLLDYRTKYCEERIRALEEKIEAGKDDMPKESLYALVKNLRAEVEEQQKKQVLASQEVEALKAALKQAQAQVDPEKVAGLAARIKALEEAKAGLEKENADLAAKLADAQGRVTADKDLLRENKRLIAAAEKSRKESEEALGQVEGLRQQIEAKAGENAALSEKIKDQQKQISEAGSALDTIKSKDRRIAKATEDLKALEAQIKSLEDQHKQLQAERKEAEEQTRELVADKAKLTDSEANLKAKNAALQGDIDSLKAAIKKLEDDLKAKDGELTALQKSISGAEGKQDGLVKRIAKLEADIAAAKGEIEVEKEKGKQLQGRLIETSKARDDNAKAAQDAEKKLAAAVEAKSTLDEKLANMESMLKVGTGRQGDLNDQIKALRGQVEEKDKRIAGIQKDLAGKDETIEKLQFRTAEAILKANDKEKEIATLTAKLAENAKGVEAKQGELAVLATREGELKKQIEGLSRDIVAVRREKGDIEGRLKDAQEEIEVMKTAGNATGKNVALLNLQKDKLAEQVAALKTTLAAAEKQRDTAQSGLATLGKDKVELERAVAGLTGDKTTLTTKADELQKALDSATKERAAAARELEAAKRSSADLERALAKAMDDKANMTAKGGDLETQLADATKELGAVKADLAKAAQAKTDAEKQVALLKVRIDAATEFISAAETQEKQAATKIAELNAQIKANKVACEKEKGEAVAALATVKDAEIAKLRTTVLDKEKAVRQMETLLEASRGKDINMLEQKAKELTVSLQKSQARIEILQRELKAFEDDENKRIATQHKAREEEKTRREAEYAKEKELHSLLTAATDAEKDNNLELAIANYKKVLQADAGRDEVVARLGILLVDRGQDKEAEKYLGRAFEANPNDTSVILPLGLTLLRQEKAAMAVAMFARATALDPKNAEYQQYLGVACRSLGWEKATEAALKRSFELDGKNAETAMNLALHYATLDNADLKKAKEWYEKARGLGAPQNAGLESVLNQ